jgi:opacity protein-like surface antigen
MRSLRVLALAGAAAITMMPAAHAADLAPPPPPVFAPPPPIGGGWYLRGDIGMTNQSVDRLSNVLDATAASVSYLDKGFSSSVLAGVGVGYQVNDWLRFDLTAEYRSKATFRGLETYTPEPASGTGVGVDDYYGSKSEWVFRANASVDLGTWYGGTAFVGGGVGTALNTISGFRDVNVATGGVAYANSATKTNFAWQVQAGLAYQVTPRTTIEMAYRYMSLGDGQSGDLITYNGVNTVNNPMVFHNITSQDFKLGIRYQFGEPSIPFGPPPLITKG